MRDLRCANPEDQAPAKTDGGENEYGSGVQLILLCGKNEKLADQLRAMQQRIPMFVQGFTQDVPLYMEIADFLMKKIAELGLRDRDKFAA